MNATQTIRPEEAAHFGGLAAEWWNPRGSSAMLHRLNPVRLRYLRERLEAEWGIAARERRPLAGRRVLDVGCGAGLLAEPLARLGGEVTAVDAAPENIAAARIHAEGQGLAIDYRAGGVESLEADGFDLITAMEVIEHVRDPAGFLRELAARLAPGGLLLLSTPNRTPLSRFALVGIAEGVGLIPRGTHRWEQFITPDEMEAKAAAAGFTVTDRRGLSLGIGSGFVLGQDLSLDYLMSMQIAG